MSNPKYIKHDLASCLSHVVEECGEVLAAIGKTQRRGLNSFNPELPPDQQETNAAWLKREMADLRGALDRLERAMETAATD